MLNYIFPFLIFFLNIFELFVTKNIVLLREEISHVPTNACFPCGRDANKVLAREISLPAYVR
jgi:hypothetical protein